MQEVREILVEEAEGRVEDHHFLDLDLLEMQEVVDLQELLIQEVLVGLEILELLETLEHLLLL
jgi:hypothetical protein